MTPEEFRAAYPKLRGWIQKTLLAHETEAQPVAALGFARLPLYFGESFLATAKFVPANRLPMPPLAEMGLGRFAAFMPSDAAAVTYLDTYFIKPGVLGSEPVHFHELIHVLQWRALGPEGFLAAYSNGLESFGYRDSPLETMAYNAEALFTQASAVFNAEEFVAKQLAKVR